MNKPTKKEFGWETWCGWANGNLNEYLKELKRWENRPRKANAGRKRTREIDPSWLPFLDKFQPVPGKSQGAFCRWAGLNRATFSAMQCKPLLSHTEYLISQWVEEIECVDFGIMPQFQSEYERLMEKD